MTETNRARQRKPMHAAPLSVHRPAVDRADLVAPLRESKTPVVSIVAPAGFGKTTLLVQWAEADPRPVAWVSLEERHNDPAVLLSSIWSTLKRAHPGVETGQPSGPFAARSPRWSALGDALSTLGTVEPFVLVLDDIHRIHHGDGVDAVAALSRHVPEGSVLAFAGRSDPPIGVALLRSRGQVTEVGPADLAFDGRQARQLFEEEGIDLPGAAVDALQERTQGWPVMLYLAAMWIRAGGSFKTAAFPGDNSGIAEFLRRELLARLPRKQRKFLVETSALDRLSGPLCDAVLGTDDSSQVLEALEGSNLLLTRLDPHGRWYRYHPLFRELLWADLERRMPERADEVLDRAAEWCEANDDPEDAIRYAMATGDVDRVAGLVAANAQRFFSHGRDATVRTWFEWLRLNAEIGSFLPAATLGVLADALMGRAADAELWADRIERYLAERSHPEEGSVLESLLAGMRSMLGRGGEEQIRADADLARRTMPADSPFRSMAYLPVGFSRLMAGELDEAEPEFQDAVEEGDRLDAAISSLVGLSELAFIAAERGDRSQARALSARAAQVRDRTGLAAYPVSALSFAMSARVALHSADLPTARRELARAHRIRPALNRSFPLLSVQALLELCRVHVALADPAGALAILRDVDVVLGERPGLGILPSRAAEFRDAAVALRADPQAATSLTTAELQLLPLLASHLSFREIAERRSVSPHTIKTQAISIYRKLGVTTRSAAIEHAETLGLLQELSFPLGSD